MSRYSTAMFYLMMVAMLYKFIATLFLIGTTVPAETTLAAAYGTTLNLIWTFCFIATVCVHAVESARIARWVIAAALVASSVIMFATLAGKNTQGYIITDFDFMIEFIKVIAVATALIWLRWKPASEQAES